MTREAQTGGPAPSYTRWRWQIFGITWLAYVGYYLTRKTFWVAKIALEKPEVMGLTKNEMGRIDVANQIAYAIGQLVCGLCGDRFGPRKVVLFGMLASVLVSLAMGTSTTSLAIGIWFTLQGLIQSTGWAPLTKNISCFFSRHERGTVMGFWFTNYAIGGLIASPFAGYFGEKMGWQWAFFAPAFALFVVWLLFYFFQRDKPEDVGLPPVEDGPGAAAGSPGFSPPSGATPAEAGTTNQPPAPAAERDGSWQVVLEVLRNPMVMMLAGVYFFLKPTRYAILAWGPKYVNEKLGTNMLESGVISAAFELAGPVSVLLGGVASDRLFQSKRMPVSILCLVLLSGVLFLMDKLPVSKPLLTACLFFSGFFLFAPDSLVSGTAAVDFGTKRGAATAAGVINCSGSVGAVIGVGVPGFLHERLGWDGIFMVLAASTFIAALLLLPKWNALPEPPKVPAAR